MAADEGYQGWANRETWALMLWINNDEGLYNMLRETVAAYSADGMDVRDAVEREVITLLDPNAYRDEYGTEQPAELRSMASEVGSLWRVDWSEVVESLTEA